MNAFGIARIVEMKKDVFQAEILFDGQLASTYFMCRDFHSTVAIRLREQYPNVKQVRSQEFLCEMDHINLFGCRSDAQSWTPPMTEEESNNLATTLERQQSLALLASAGVDVVINGREVE